MSKGLEDGCTLTLRGSPLYFETRKLGHFINPLRKSWVLELEEPREEIYVIKNTPPQASPLLSKRDYVRMYNEIDSVKEFYRVESYLSRLVASQRERSRG